MVDYTTVIAVDESHLRQLRLTWPTWVQCKPSLLEHPLLVIYDHDVKFNEIADIIDQHPNIMSQPWPLPGVSYARIGEARWYEPQRVKMLAGFVHATAARVRTKYWLKLDLDTVATGQDNWIDETWFENNPAIVAQPWGYTKPALQMLELDGWVNLNLVRRLKEYPDLNLKPNPGSDLVKHARIISWCGFFNTEFTKFCSDIAEKYCGAGHLPCPSQDGFMWYCAQRLNLPIVRPNMKTLGWVHKSTIRGIKECIKEHNSEDLIEITRKAF